MKSKNTFGEKSGKQKEDEKMKYDLKNVEWTIDPIKTRKNFEKELRDELVYAEKARKAWRGESKHRIDEEIAREWDGIIIAIEEILEG